MPKQSEWIELVEAARRLRLGYPVVHRLALKGILDARRINGRWSVSRASVDRYLAQATPEPAPAT